ncbi:hypothetical protein ElyMa_000967100 [Elysia marginata]|uniref:PLAT domain-containing protein n=1 Tax=Elysia marginata TaxID=1093978 RepID=A0AAV4HH33_9GAST|nr:hypothetical protein ElyMa_000967100 [Elysia marginata]
MIKMAATELWRSDDEDFNKIDFNKIGKEEQTSLFRLRIGHNKLTGSIAMTLYGNVACNIYDVMLSHHCYLLNAHHATKNTDTQFSVCLEFKTIVHIKLRAENEWLCRIAWFAPQQHQGLHGTEAARRYIIMPGV